MNKSELKKTALEAFDESGALYQQGCYEQAKQKALDAWNCYFELQKMRGEDEDFTDLIYYARDMYTKCEDAIKQQAEAANTAEGAESLANKYYLPGNGELDMEKAGNLFNRAAELYLEQGKTDKAVECLYRYGNTLRFRGLIDEARDPYFRMEELNGDRLGIFVYSLHLARTEDRSDEGMKIFNSLYAEDYWHCDEELVKISLPTYEEGASMSIDTMDKDFVSNLQALMRVYNENPDSIDGMDANATICYFDYLMRHEDFFEKQYDEETDSYQKSNYSLLVDFMNNDSPMAAYYLAEIEINEARISRERDNAELFEGSWNNAQYCLNKAMSLGYRGAFYTAYTAHKEFGSDPDAVDYLRRCALAWGINLDDEESSPESSPSEAQDSKKWTNITVNGRIMVSDFTNIHCTDSFSHSYERKDVKPGMTINTPYYYYDVEIVEIEGEEVVVKIAGKTARLSPGESFNGPNHPLDYAWSELWVRLDED